MALAICTLSACSHLTKQFTSPTFSEQDLVGKKWYCESSYDTWHLNTKEYYQYKPNGDLFNEGVMTFLWDGQEFTYKFTANARWQLDGWYLLEKLDSYTFKPNYSAKTKSALNANPKLKEKEKWIFSLLQSEIERNQKSVARREIESLTPMELTTTAGSSYVICDTRAN